MIRSLGLDSVHVVGSSLGGMIAQLLALRHRHLVRSLTLPEPLWPTIAERIAVLVSQVEHRDLGD